MSTHSVYLDTEVEYGQNPEMSVPSAWTSPFLHRGGGEAVRLQMSDAQEQDANFSSTRFMFSKTR